MDDYLNKTVEYLEQWLKNFEKNKQALPIIKKILKVYKWKKETLETMPDIIKKENKKTINKQLSDSNEYNFITANLLFNPLVNTDKLQTMVISSTNSSSDMLSSIGFTDYQYDTEWAVTSIDSFKKIQEEFELCNIIKQQLGDINIDLVNDFELMESNYYNSISNLEKKVNFGISMRNLLEHYKGQLFSIAMKKYEQKIKWIDMVDRLCSFEKDSFEYNLLLKEENNWKVLHSKLSDLLKNKIDCTENQLEIERINLLSHIFTVLSLIKKQS